MASMIEIPATTKNKIVSIVPPPTGKTLAAWIDWLIENGYNKLTQQRDFITNFIEKEVCKDNKENIAWLYQTTEPSLSGWIQANIQCDNNDTIHFWEQLFYDIQDLESKCTPMLADWISYLRESGFHSAAHILIGYFEREQISVLNRCKYLSNYIAGFNGRAWTDSKEGFDVWNEIHGQIETAEKKLFQ